MPLLDAGNSLPHPQLHTFDGILSDFDGTILDSTDVVKFWHKIGAELDVSPNEILAKSHGRRSIDTVALYDKSKANWEYISSIEKCIPSEFGANTLEIPGSRDLLTALELNDAKWGIVTSATRSLFNKWIEIFKLPCSAVTVTAEDVVVGKPHPEGYLLGEKCLRVEGPATILVLEDSPAGVRAGKNAGHKVLAVNTTHSIKDLQQAGADWIVQDLRSVTLKVVSNGRTQLEFTDILN